MLDPHRKDWASFWGEFPNPYLIRMPSRTCSTPEDPYAGKLDLPLSLSNFVII